MKIIAAIVLLLSGLAGSSLGADLLIVADEFPAMRILAEKIKAQENLTSEIIAQTNLPGRLEGYRAVIVYIHGNLKETAENAFIDYTRNGCRLVALHHSISSGKRKNKQWFNFLGVDLPTNDFSQGGYKWIEPATIQVVNLAPNHYITTHQMAYPTNIPFSLEGGAGQSLPGITLDDSEAYLNHLLLGPRTTLLGLKYLEPKSGRTYMQAHAGWTRPAGKGLIVYLMPGHSTKEFEDPAFSRIVINAVTYKP